MVLLTPATVDQSARMPGGLLAKALPAPPGWQRGGLLLPFYGCGEPVLRDKCVEAEDVPNQNDPAASFPTVPIEQGSMCSTTGGDTVLPSALARFTATADWALTKQLQTDQADTGAPKLDDAGAAIATVASANFTHALGRLEQHAAETGFGAVWVIHTTVIGMDYLTAQGAVVNGVTANGAKVIAGTGYENIDGTHVPIWVTGQVWASVDEIEPVENIAHRQNNVEAWARGIGVAAFDPCMLALISVTVPA